MESSERQALGLSCARLLGFTIRRFYDIPALNKESCMCVLSVMREEIQKKGLDLRPGACVAS